MVVLVSGSNFVAPINAKSLQPAQTSANTTHSTPQLIEAAFQQGQITADQRLLYLGYAVYEAHLLPPEFVGQKPWSGTHVVRELNQVREEIVAGKRNSSPELKAFLLRPSTQAATICDDEDGSKTYQTSNFHLSYDSVVDLSINDYGASLETTFDTLVNTYGLAKPPFRNNPMQRYPVLVADIGAGLYGYVTTGGGSFTGLVGNNPNTPEVETRAFASCMVINSDMTSFAADTAGALLALQATVAHEYFHSIQFGYGEPGNNVTDIWYESMAAYVEDEVFPDAHDNYNYLYPNLTVPFQINNDEVYSSWILFRYAAEQLGGMHTANGGSEIMKSTWQKIATGKDGMTAYDEALQAKGTSFANLYHNFAISMRFMKNCSTTPNYCFTDGSDIRAYVGTPTNHHTINTIGSSYTGSLADGFTANWIGMPKSGTYSISVKNNSTNGGSLRASMVAELGNDLHITPLSGLANANGSITLESYTPPTGAANVILVLTNQANSSGNRSYQISTQAATPIEYTEFIYAPLVRR
jgi:hypothetical protein